MNITKKEKYQLNNKKYYDIVFNKNDFFKLPEKDINTLLDLGDDYLITSKTATLINIVECDLESICWVEINY